MKMFKLLDKYNDVDLEKEQIFEIDGQKMFEETDGKVRILILTTIALNSLIISDD